MNPLSNPEHAMPGTILTRNEFENCAEEAQIINDLLDRDDLGSYEFIETAISRANARRTPQNLHAWVGSLHFRTIALVPTPLARVIDTLRKVAYSHEASLVDVQGAITEALKAGTKP
jgi:hypothetical protein